MPNVILRVTLDEQQGCLDVDQSGNGNQIPHGQNDTIIWKLSGNAAQGSFTGFAWKQTPPTGVFGNAEPSGSEMSISDNNTDPNGVNSSGTWIYQIWATINNQQYSTLSTIPNPRNVPMNPTIQNN